MAFNIFKSNQEALQGIPRIDNQKVSSLIIEWMTTKEAAEYLRLPVKSLRNLTSNGKVPFYKLSRLNRYKKSDLDFLLQKQKRGNHEY